MQLRLTNERPMLQQTPAHVRAEISLETRGAAIFCYTYPQSLKGHRLCTLAPNAASRRCPILFVESKPLHRRKKLCLANGSYGNVNIPISHSAMKNKHLSPKPTSSVIIKPENLTSTININGLEHFLGRRCFPTSKAAALRHNPQQCLQCTKWAQVCRSMYMQRYGCKTSEHKTSNLHTPPNP